MAITEADGSLRTTQVLPYIRLTGEIAAITADATSSEEGLSQILQRICEGLDWNVGLFWAAHGNPEALRLAACWPGDRFEHFLGISRTRVFSPGEGLPGRVFAAGRADWIEDLRTDANFPRGPYAAADGLVSGFGFPVLSGKQRLGVMEFFSSVARRPDPAMLEVMGALGTQLGLFVERVQSLEEQHVQDSIRQRLFNYALDAIVTADQSGRILDINPAAEGMFGCTRQDMVGRPLEETLVPPSLRDRHSRAFAAHVATGVSTILDQRLELEALRFDGSVFPVELIVTQIPHGDTSVYTAFIKDISERQAYEAQTKKQMELISGIHRFSQAVVREGDLQTIYKIAVDLVVSTLGARKGSLLLMDRAKIMRFKSWQGLSPRYRKATTGHTPWAPDVEDPQPVLVPDVLEVEELASLHQVILDEGIRSLAFIPLVASGKLIGKLMVYYGEVHDFTPEEVTYAETLANEIAGAIAWKTSLGEQQQLYRRETRMLQRVSESAARLAKAVTETRASNRRLAALADTSAELVHSLTHENVADRVAAFARRVIRADAYAVWRQTPEGWRITGSSGLSEDFKSSAINVVEPMVDVIRMVNDTESDALNFETRRPYLARQGIRALLALPLRIHSKNTGTLVFYYRAPHQFSPGEVQVCTALADLAASALTVSELYSLQGDLRGRAEKSRDRLALIAEASDILGSSLDPGTTLARLGELVVPKLGDICLIHVIQLDGSVDSLTFSAAGEVTRVTQDNPGYSSWAGRLPEGPRTVIRDGMPQLKERATAEIVESFAGQGIETAALTRMAPSVLSVPLSARGRVFGSLTLISGKRTYDRDDVSTVAELGRRAGWAIDNARLYEQSIVAGKAKDEFLGLVSHELRTPLTVIFGGINVLASRSYSLSAESRDSLMDDLVIESERLRQITENLLALARAQLGQELEIEPLLMSKAVAGAVRAIKREGDRNRFVVNGPENEVPVRANRVSVDQVLLNLMSNSLKYGRPDSLIAIEISPFGGRSEYRMSVTNQGDGVPPPEINRLFDRFYRGNAPEGTSGLGLGLTVCKRLVESQGGVIWAESANGEFRVHFTLPLDLS